MQLTTKVGLGTLERLISSKLESYYLAKLKASCNSVVAGFFTLKIQAKPMNITLNSYFDNKAPASTLAINEIVKARWAKGERVLHMGFGESRFAVHPKLQQALKDNAAQKSYLSSKGLPELCEAVAEYYSEKLALDVLPKQVIIGPGSKSLLFALQQALDADLFLPTPSWVSYGPQAELINNKFYYIPSKVENNYQFDLKAFDKLVKQSTNTNKLLIINSPNNPTGQMFTSEFLQELADYCRKEKILVISDEIYFLVQHGEQKHTSIAEFYPEGTFILGGLSKHLSIGGWRIGVAVLPNTSSGNKLMTALSLIASETWSSVAAPMQYAALTAYSNDDDIEAYIQLCTQIHGVRTRFIHRKLTELKIKCTKPQGAFYLTANFDLWSKQLEKLGVNTSAQLASYFLDKHDVAALPADAFGIPAETLSLRLATSYLDLEKESDSDRLLNLFASVAEEEFLNVQNHPNTHAAINEFTRFIESLN